MIIVLWVLFAILFAVAGWILLYFRLASRIGANPAGERLERIQALTNYHAGKLHNLVPTDM